MAWRWARHNLRNLAIQCTASPLGFRSFRFEATRGCITNQPRPQREDSGGSWILVLLLSHTERLAESASTSNKDAQPQDAQLDGECLGRGFRVTPDRPAWLVNRATRSPPTSQPWRDHRMPHFRAPVDPAVWPPGPL